MFSYASALRNALASIAVTCAAAATAGEWTEDQKRMGAALAAVTVVDWAQTRYIADSGGRFYETNPIIGKYPSMRRVDTYFAASLLLGAAVLDALPTEYRDTALKAGLVLELLVVSNNARIGVGVKF